MFLDYKQNNKGLITQYAITADHGLNYYPLYFYQDVHVTGFAAQACGIKRRNNPGFFPGPEKKTFYREKDILIH